MTAAPLKQPTGPFHEAVLDFVSAEVWARPGLTRKERRLISLSCAGAGKQATGRGAIASSARSRAAGSA